MMELREAERVSANPVIRYWTTDRNMMISQAYNISENGISFNTGKIYPKNTPVYIQMRSPDYSERIIFFKAKIIHQKFQRHTNLYKTGAAILQFKDKNDSALLQRYIDFAKSCVN